MELFRLESKLLRKYCQVTMLSGSSSVESEKDKNPFVSLLSGHLSLFEVPIECNLYRGGDFGDFLDTGSALVYLISDLVEEAFTKANLTGWSTFPVKITDKNNNEINRYHGLSITGRSGPIDYNQSEIIEKKLVPHGPTSKYYKGLFPIMEEWDGSDFFLPKGYFGIIITAKAASVIRKSKFTNVKVTPLEKIEMNEFTVQTALKNRAVS